MPQASLLYGPGFIEALNDLDKYEDNAKRVMRLDLARKYLEDNSSDLMLEVIRKKIDNRGKD